MALKNYIDMKKKHTSLIQVSFFVFSLLLSPVSFSQSISPFFFGQNAWMPDTVGNALDCPHPPCVLFGKLHSKWDEVKNSGTKIMRFGGIKPDSNRPTNYQYIRMVDSIRANGMEPVLQVPFNNRKYTPMDAAEIVKYVNINRGRKVKYWTITNEPDLSGLSSVEIAYSIKAYSLAMKMVDPSIKIIAPEISSYNHPLMKDFTSPGSLSDLTGKNFSGQYFVDIISFHTYPFTGAQTREEVIDKLRSPYGLRDNLAILNERLETCNEFHGRTGESVLKIAITEANINHLNDSTDYLYSTGANSFIGGQFWVELMGIAMEQRVAFVNFFSVMEGGTSLNNIGYINQSNNRKPTYYHYKMLADNFKGNYCRAGDNQNRVKVFASKDDNQVAIIFLNQKMTKDYDITMRLNIDSLAMRPSIVHVDAGIAKEYRDKIYRESSVLLVFDTSGALIKKLEYKLRGHANKNLPPSSMNFPSGILASDAEKNLDPDFNIYPNPNKGLFNLEYVSPHNDILFIKITTLMGEIVYTEKVSVGSGKYLDSIDLRNFPSGIFVFHIETSVGTSSKKIVVQ